MIPLRVWYGAAALLALAGVAVRVVPPSLPRPDAALLALPAASVPAVPERGQATAGYEAVVTANIFSQTRSAPRRRFSPAGLTPGRPRRVVARGPQVRLYGVTVGPQGAVALIHADPTLPGAQIYRVGDLVAGARLVAITDSTVTLAEPSGPLVLRLESPRRIKP